MKKRVTPSSGITLSIHGVAICVRSYAPTGNSQAPQLPLHVARRRGNPLSFPGRREKKLVEGDRKIPFYKKNYNLR